MIFTISFYIFSLILSYLDCTKYRIPNITIGALLIILLIFGYLENQLNIYSFIISFLILVFFVIILLITPTIILGGGDIKYMMVIAIYLEPLLFPLFILSTGILQMFFLIYFQKVKKRRVAPMAPPMFLAVIISEILFQTGIYHF
jgi:Flp pilus assembly protein protease CpaA